MKIIFFLSVLLTMVSSTFADPLRIVAYGDSLTYGWVPNANSPSERYNSEARWPMVVQK
ncbi:MAG TPA: hypothetical protein VGD78_23105 [Chthoniobacterales bacterium]